MSHLSRARKHKNKVYLQQSLLLDKAVHKRQTLQTRDSRQLDGRFSPPLV